MTAALLQIRAKIIPNYSSSIFSKLLIIIANCVNFYYKFQQFSLQIASKIIIIDMYIHALLFTTEASFSSQFFFNIPKISAQIIKLTKYQSNRDVIAFFNPIRPGSHQINMRQFKMTTMLERFKTLFPHFMTFRFSGAMHNF